MISINEKSSNYNLPDIHFSFYCGLIIRKTRKENGLSGQELADKLNVSQQQMSRYERGVNKISIDMLMNIVFVLDISFDKFLRKVFFEIKRSDNDKSNLLKMKISKIDSFYFY